MLRSIQVKDGLLVLIVFVVVCYHFTTTKTGQNQLTKNRTVGRSRASFVDYMPDHTWAPLPTQVEDTSHRRTILFHVGPHKHGTTFLQCSLSDPSLEQALQADHWVYLGRDPDHCRHPNATRTDYPIRSSMSGIFAGRVERIFTPNATLQSSFVTALDGLRRQNKNALVISEDLMILSPFMGQMLLDYLHRQGWVVKIVLAYRPLYDYLPSLYSQRTKPRSSHKQFPWPDEKDGRCILPFDLTDRETYTQEIEPQVQQGLSKSYQSYLVWSGRHPDALEIIDMSNLTMTTATADPYLHHFVCHSLASAPQACRAVNSYPGPLYSNPSFQLDYDLLAVAAYERGWLCNRQGDDTAKGCPAFPRLDAAREIAHFLKTRAVNSTSIQDHALARKCLPNSTMDHLYAVSLQADRVMYGASQAREAHHKAGFDKQVANRKYCWVDAERALDEDADLRRFLRGLAPTNC